MVTERLYYKDQYLREGEARVLSCESKGTEWNIQLDSTIFYPVGGGQPSDLGKIGEAQVLQVTEREGVVFHVCDRPIAVGEQVHCVLDWERRFGLMQQHSGEHIVSGIIHGRFGYENVGFHMGSDVITIDFNGELTMEDLRTVEQEANRVVWQNIPTKIWYPEKAELERLPYRSKKELSGAVRLVRFGDTDLCACCGTHVAATGEIGMIKLFSTTRFRGGSRVEMLCGKRALEWINVLCDQNHEISGLLSAKPMHTAEAVRRLQQEQQAGQYRLTQVENQIFSLRAKELAGAGDVLLFEEAMSPDALRRFADMVIQLCGGRCGIFAGEDGAYKYVIGTKNGDLRGLVKELNAALSGRGGGKPNFAQGSVGASRAQIEDFFAAL